MATAYSLLQIRQALAEEAFLGTHPIRITTTGAGSTTSVVIADLAFSATGITANAYHDCWLYNTAASPTAPFSSRVDSQSGLAVASGTLTCHPAFGSSPGSGTEIIFTYDLHPDELHKAINRVLRNLMYFAYLPVTMVWDGNMEDPGVTHWPVIAGGTRTKISVGSAWGIIFGRQTLQVTGTTNDGVSSDDVYVIGGEPLIVSVPVQVTAGSAVIQLYDQTNSAVIQSVTVSQIEPVTVQFYPNAPATCKIVRFRFLAGAVGTTFNIGPVTLLSQNRRRYPLDFSGVTTATVSGIERAADVRDVFWLPQGQGTTVTNAYYSFTEPFADSSFVIEEDVRSGAPVAIVLPAYPTYPYLMRVKRVFPELTVTAATINATTNTTLADRDTLVQGAMYYLERARYARLVGTNPPLAAEHLGKAREHARRFAMMRQAQGYGTLVREQTPARMTATMASMRSAVHVYGGGY